MADTIESLRADLNNLRREFEQFRMRAATVIDRFDVDPDPPDIVKRNVDPLQQMLPMYLVDQFENQ